MLSIGLFKVTAPVRAYAFLQVSGLGCGGGGWGEGLIASGRHISS